MDFVSACAAPGVDVTNAALLGIACCESVVAFLRHDGRVSESALERVWDKATALLGQLRCAPGDLGVDASLSNLGRYRKVLRRTAGGKSGTLEVIPAALDDFSDDSGHGPLYAEMVYLQSHNTSHFRAAVVSIETLPTAVVFFPPVLESEAESSVACGVFLPCVSESELVRASRAEGPVGKAAASALRCLPHPSADPNAAVSLFFRGGSSEELRRTIVVPLGLQAAGRSLSMQLGSDGRLNLHLTGLRRQTVRGYAEEAAKYEASKPSRPRHNPHREGKWSPATRKTNEALEEAQRAAAAVASDAERRRALQDRQMAAAKEKERLAELEREREQQQRQERLEEQERIIAQQEEELRQRQKRLLDPPPSSSTSSNIYAHPSSTRGLSNELEVLEQALDDDDDDEEEDEVDEWAKELRALDKSFESSDSALRNESSRRARGVQALRMYREEKDRATPSQHPQPPSPSPTHEPKGTVSLHLEMARVRHAIQQRHTEEAYGHLEDRSARGRAALDRYERRQHTEGGQESRSREYFEGGEDYFKGGDETTKKQEYFEGENETARKQEYFEGGDETTKKQQERRSSTTNVPEAQAVLPPRVPVVQRRQPRVDNFYADDPDKDSKGKEEEEEEKFVDRVSRGGVRVVVGAMGGGSGGGNDDGGKKVKKVVASRSGSSSSSPSSKHTSSARPPVSPRGGAALEIFDDDEKKTGGASGGLAAAFQRAGKQRAMTPRKSRSSGAPPSPTVEPPQSVPSGGVALPPSPSPRRAKGRWRADKTDDVAARLERLEQELAQERRLRKALEEGRALEPPPQNENTDSTSPRAHQNADSSSAASPRMHKRGVRPQSARRPSPSHRPSTPSRTGVARERRGGVEVAINGSPRPDLNETPAVIRKVRQRHQRAESSPSSKRRTRRGVAPDATNVMRVRNALKHVCLAAPRAADTLAAVLDAIDEAPPGAFLVLFRSQDSKLYRGLYHMDPVTTKTTLIHGVGPKTITQDDIRCLFKYSTGARAFQTLPTTTLSIATDAVSLQRTRSKRN